MPLTVGKSVFMKFVLKDSVIYSEQFWSCLPSFDNQKLILNTLLLQRLYMLVSLCKCNNEYNIFSISEMPSITHRPFINHVHCITKFSVKLYER